ncbi:hypothetical protein GJAV_G00089910 [Gymnothorax javanicus]|nr:hypothetical protein GJAV_G00089910 [Gymnothorax javanicus]
MCCSTEKQGCLAGHVRHTAGSAPEWAPPRPPPTLSNLTCRSKRGSPAYMLLQIALSAPISSSATDLDNQLLIAICTPLMKRVHSQIQQSGEMVFVDSSGNCDRRNHCIFLLMTHSTAGGSPLEILITASENQATVTAALQLLNSVLPAERFFGRREEGPRVMLADDCLALRQSLDAVYPGATIILCVFHLLQALWRGLQGADSRPYSPEAAKFLRHLAEVFKKREEWAICLQSELPTRGRHANSYVESAMRILKEKVFCRLKAYNVTQMLSFVTTRLEQYYIRHLTDVANNRVKRIKHVQHEDVDCEAIVQQDQMNYIVPSSSGHEEHHVNMALGSCSCALGISGGTCKHQSAVASKEGGMDIPDDWFQTLARPHPPADPTGTSYTSGAVMEFTLAPLVLDPGNLELTERGSDASSMEFPPNETDSGSVDTEEEPMDCGLVPAETDSVTGG